MLLAVLIVGFGLLYFQMGSLRVLLKDQVKQQAIMIALLDTISPADPQVIAAKARSEWRGLADKFPD